MNFTQNFLKIFTIVFSITLLAACDSDSSNKTSTAYQYSTTSTKGDFTDWTITGDQLVANWQVVNDTGGIDHTFDIEATCGVADSSGVQECAFGSVSCTDGLATCPTLPTGSFNIMAVPGVALFAHDGDQLHVGFTKNENACTENVSGDYTYVHMGLGKRDIYGMYRSDADFVSIIHSDFGFETLDSNASQTISYNTDSPTEMLVDNGCEDGVRKRTTSGGDAIRSMMTANGLFVLDLPSGEGGLLAFEATNAAVLSDFAGKSFGGLTFPDNDDASPVSAEFGDVIGDKIELTAVTDGTTLTIDLMKLETASATANPAFPDFSTAPGDYVGTTLAGDYPTPKDIPGLFKLDDATNTDTGRVIMAAVKLNDKVVAFGVNYNFRDGSDINPSTGSAFSDEGLYNTGSFLLFEK